MEREKMELKKFLSQYITKLLWEGKIYEDSDIQKECRFSGLPTKTFFIENERIAIYTFWKRKL